MGQMTRCPCLLLLALLGCTAYNSAAEDLPADVPLSHELEPATGVSDAAPELCEPGYAGELPVSTIDRFEVAYGEYQLCVQAEVCRRVQQSWDEADLPVADVTWFDAWAYCEWMGKSLPSVADWTVAVGAPERSHPWGDEPPSCSRCAIAKDSQTDCGLDGPVPVGSRPAGATPDGVHDLQGNLREWLLDAADGKACSAGASFGDPSERVTLRAESGPAWWTDNDVGFRCTARPTAPTSRALEPRVSGGDRPHFVELPKLGLAVMSTEVTAAQYADCIASGKCPLPELPLGPWQCNIEKPDRGLHPMNCVGPEGAQAFCASQNARLPTELEWDSLAAQLSTWGDGWECDKAWVGYGPEHLGCERFSTTTVGSLPGGATGSGVYDLVGNVWEIVATGSGYARRGAGWDVYWSTSADGEIGPHDRMQLNVAYSESTGFRCVRVI